MLNRHKAERANLNILTENTAQFDHFTLIIKLTVNAQAGAEDSV